MSNILYVAPYKVQAILQSGYGNSVRIPAGLDLEISGGTSTRLGTAGEAGLAGLSFQTKLGAEMSREKTSGERQTEREMSADLGDVTTLRNLWGRARDKLSDQRCLKSLKDPYLKADDWFCFYEQETYCCGLVRDTERDGTTVAVWEFDTVLEEVHAAYRVAMSGTWDNLTSEWHGLSVDRSGSRTEAMWDLLKCASQDGKLSERESVSPRRMAETIAEMARIGAPQRRVDGVAQVFHVVPILPPHEEITFQQRRFPITKLIIASPLYILS